MIQFNTTRSKWNRVSRTHRCPICGKPDWCLTTGPNDNPDAAICSRVESAKRIGTKGAGWLHRLRDDDQWRDRPLQRRVTLAAAPEPTIEFSGLAEQYVAALSISGLERLEAAIGLTAESLDRLHVGWSTQHRAFTFPMVNHHGHVCGIRLRGRDGRKWSIRGGHDGLFIALGVGPDNLSGYGGRLVICEGPTDTAALLDLGLPVVGRPSCNGGVEQLVDLARGWHPDAVAIIADADAPGQHGARYLASCLVGHVTDGVRVVTPPAKDAREWVLRGATREDVLQAIDAVPALQLTYRVKAVAR